jgi:hypothetical protein
MYNHNYVFSNSDQVRNGLANDLNIIIEVLERNLSADRGEIDALTGVSSLGEELNGRFKTLRAMPSTWNEDEDWLGSIHRRDLSRKFFDMKIE